MSEISLEASVRSKLGWTDMQIARSRNIDMKQALDKWELQQKPPMTPCRTPSISSMSSTSTASKTISTSLATVADKISKQRQAIDMLRDKMKTKTSLLETMNDMDLGDGRILQCSLQKDQEKQEVALLELAGIRDSLSEVEQRRSEMRGCMDPEEWSGIGYDIESKEITALISDIDQFIQM